MQFLSGLFSNRAFVVGVLFVASLFNPFLLIVAIPLAYIAKKRTDQEWEATHFTYLLRTFWIAISVALAATILFLLTIWIMDLRFGASLSDDLFYDLLMWWGVIIFSQFVFFAIRSIFSVTKSALHKPMPNPRNWLF